MSTQYSDEDAQTFVRFNGNLPIKGDTSRPLSDYIRTQQPAQGVIVNPALGVNVLVWFDYTGKLHVVEDVDNQFATNVALPPYHTEDESFWYNVSENIVKTANNFANAIPNASTVSNVLIGVVALVLFLKLK